MFDTAFTLGLTQFARSLSFPERLQRRPFRNVALEALRARNTGLDALFYDVKALSSEEVFYISDSITAEGLIMIVPPTGAGMLTLCDSVDEYLLRGGKDVHVLAIAGVGGSAIGAAAFARNVADAVGAPVAAIVSGYGLGDVVVETMGGSFFFGWLGHFRSQMETLDDAVGRPQLGAYAQRRLKPEPERRSCLDADTAAELLGDPRLSFHMLAAHSSGNRVLSEALYELRRSNRQRLRALAEGLRIVTFGGRIVMPPEFTDVVDVVGELDWYGEVNSRPQIDTDIRVPLAGHSTNTDLPGSLHVTRVLKEIIGHSLPAVVETATPAPADVEPLAENIPVADAADTVKDEEVSVVPENAPAAPGVRRPAARRRAPKKNSIH
ncbi:cell envelope biogenesis protein OmpA [Ciceribacter ferrooxidans]|uniref:cell envelope biogenesis protein OmpA n=1 Tax=Ciceribacter ferrooxidans TaxID=2509717 RepID=UPI00196B8071|nr:cell envelope biogenesis protein OmpA [Ciceribacter ferrooxidans]